MPRLATKTFVFTAVLLIIIEFGDSRFDWSISDMVICEIVLGDIHLEVYDSKLVAILDVLCQYSQTYYLTGSSDSR